MTKIHESFVKELQFFFVTTIMMLNNSDFGRAQRGKMYEGINGLPLGKMGR